MTSATVRLLDAAVEPAGAYKAASPQVYQFVSELKRSLFADDPKGRLWFKEAHEGEEEPVPTISRELLNSTICNLKDDRREPFRKVLKDRDRDGLTKKVRTLLSKAKASGFVDCSRAEVWLRAHAIE